MSTVPAQIHTHVTTLCTSACTQAEHHGGEPAPGMSPSYSTMPLAELLRHAAQTSAVAGEKALAVALLRHAASRCACFECRSGKHGPQ